MTEVPTTLFDRHAGTEVPAVVRFGLSVGQVLEAEAARGPARLAAVSRLVHAGHPDDRMPQHWHWDWVRKTHLLGRPGHSAVGVEAGGAMQGMMLLSLVNYAARLEGQRDQPLAYVVYLESAPWNVEPLAEAPRYGGTGTVLIEAAVRASADAGFDGLIGLHSLPQAESFYERRCGLTRAGADDRHEGLVYFETTRERAAEILGEEGV